MSSKPSPLMSTPSRAALAESAGADPSAAAETLGSWSVPMPAFFRGLAHAVADAAATPMDARIAAIDGADGVLLALLAVAGLGAVPMLSRDRTDTPLLLAVAGYGALGSAFLLAPRHADARANLAYVREELGLPPADAGGLYQALLDGLSLWTRAEAALAVLATSLLLFVCLLFEALRGGRLARFAAWQLGQQH